MVGDKFDSLVAGFEKEDGNAFDLSILESLVSPPKGMSDEQVARNISLGLPTGIARLVSGMLGTEKLQLQLTEPDFGAVDRPLIFEFFRSALIADLQLPATPSAIDAAFQVFRTHRYLTEALIWKVRDLRKYSQISEIHFDQIMGAIADAFAELKGGSASERGEQKRKELQRLRNEGVLLRLKKPVASE